MIIYTIITRDIGIRSNDISVWDPQRRSFIAVWKKHFHIRFQVAVHHGDPFLPDGKGPDGYRQHFQRKRSGTAAEGAVGSDVIFFNVILSGASLDFSNLRQSSEGSVSPRNNFKLPPIPRTFAVLKNGIRRGA